MPGPPGPVGPCGRRRTEGRWKQPKTSVSRPGGRHVRSPVPQPAACPEFDAASVLAMYDEDPELGREVARWVGEVVAHRLHSARVRLLDLFGPYGAGTLAGGDGKRQPCTGEPEPHCCTGPLS